MSPPEGGRVAESASDLVVETNKLTKIYQNRQIALNDVSLRIEPGMILGLLGPNGAGKTTLLRILLGLHRATAGTAHVFGQKMTPNSAYLRRRIGYIPTNPSVISGMTPITYLDYTARLYGLPLQVRKPRLASLLRAADLLNVSGDPIDNFSNGMVARLAVACSLINDPELLIWDEPTHGLDLEARRSMLEMLKTLTREKTLIICSHNLADIEEVCNHAAVMSRGHLIYFGSLQDLKGKIRKHHYELDLEGDQKAITKSTTAIKGMGEVKLMVLKHRRLELRMADEANIASALANVLMILADNKVTLLGIRCLGQTEQAFLDILEKEASRGFARALPEAA